MVIKKSLGQNFLIDHNIARKIVKLIPGGNSLNIIEIGPGKGFLTNYLINLKPKKLILIEKDYDLYDNLTKEYKNFNDISLFNLDALKTNIIDNVPKPKVIVSNLPYNISIKLIINWLSNIKQFNGLYLMIQKEVAHKFIYKTSIKSNRLNILANLMSDYKKEFDVTPNVFFPKPKVFSSVVSFKPNIKEKIDITKFQIFTRTLFSTKRKKTYNNLNRVENYKRIINNNKNNIKKKIDMSKRPEELSFDEIINLFKMLH